MKPSQRQIEMPGWAIEAAKIIGSVIIALALGYAKFSQVEHRVDDHHSAITEIKSRAETTRELASLIQQKVGTLEVQQTLVSGEFRDSLKRIEDDIKDLKLDFKTARTSANKP